MLHHSKQLKPKKWRVRTKVTGFVHMECLIWGLIWNNVVTYLPKCGTLVLPFTTQKNQRVNFFLTSTGAFIKYSMYLRHTFKTFTHSISLYLMRIAIWGVGITIHFTKSKQKHLWSDHASFSKKCHCPLPRKRSNTIF